MPRRRNLISITSGLICLLGVLALGRLSVMAESAPAQSLIPLFLKIASYDEAFDQSQVSAVNIVVLYDMSNALSYKQSLELRDYFAGHKSLKVEGVDVRYEAVALSELPGYIKGLSATDYNMLVVTAIADHRISGIVEATQKAGIRTYSLVPKHVAMGIAISVDPTRKHKSILVNLDAARLEGSHYSAHLLKLCDIVKG